MKLVIGKKYRYENIRKVGRSCEKRKKVLEVIYIGKEDNREVFSRENGMELLIYDSDVSDVISEI